MTHIMIEIPVRDPKHEDISSSSHAGAQGDSAYLQVHAELMGTSSQWLPSLDLRPQVECRLNFHFLGPSLVTYIHED